MIVRIVMSERAWFAGLPNQDGYAHNPSAPSIRIRCKEERGEKSRRRREEREERREEKEGGGKYLSSIPTRMLFPILRSL